MPAPKYIGIIADLQRRIDVGELTPGDRIFSIREMCDEYGVSSIVALRVFKELAAGGVVEKRDGEGYYVLPSGGGRGIHVVCAFRPLRDFSFQENFGNRIIYGIMNEALGSHRRCIFPESAMRLRSHVPTDNEVRMIADEVFSIPDIGAIILDMRIPDESIRRYFVPRAGSVPLVLVGRRSKAPVKTVYVPMEAIGRELGTIVRRTVAEQYIVLPANVNSSFPESRLMATAFLETLGAPDDAVFTAMDFNVVSDALNREIADQAAARIVASRGKTFVLCGFDPMAESFEACMSERGLAAGRDYMLMGFGGLGCGQYHNPPLSTVEIAITDLGAEAVRLAFSEPNATSRAVTYAIRFQSTF